MRSTQAAIRLNGYAARPSVRAGETISLHIAAPVRRFRVDFYRAGARLWHAGFVEWPGRRAAPRRWDEDWRWPEYDFIVPSEWPSGVYVGVLSWAGKVPRRPRLDAREARLLFVVRSATGSRSTVLYKIPTFTYQAYNLAGGGSLYSAPTVSLLRPGGGTGGPVKGLRDVYDPSSPRRQTALDQHVSRCVPNRRP